jgi:hypothetical protein
MNAVEKYRSEMLYAMGGDNRYHIDPRTAIEMADAAIAELETENKRRVDMSVCNVRCPACVEFETTFQTPKVKYMGCLRSQSETTRLLNRHAAPLGQPCPYVSC